MTDVEDVAIDQAPSTIPVDIQLEWLRSMMSAWAATKTRNGA